MAEPKQPQDHKPKAETVDDGPRLFTFTHLGKEYTLPLAADEYITAGFYRRHRHEDDAQFGMSVFELLSDNDEKILAVLDATGREAVKETDRVLEEFRDYIGASRGE